MITIPFIKMHGMGNDYVYIDCFPSEVAKRIAAIDLPTFARRVSDRHRGVGSDGLVLILPSKEADAQMRIFNADGSEAQMCGNAIRCVGKYLYESGLCRRIQVMVKTQAGIRSLSLDVTNGIVEQVTVNMGHPVINSDVLICQNDPVGFTSVNMGNPHAVFFRQAEMTPDEVEAAGRFVSTHPHFPEGTNVEYVRIVNTKELRMRVYERGTGETLACGTGACAAAVAAIWNGWTERNITVHMPGGDLNIRWENPSGSVFMTGPATEVYRGEYLLSD